jgi:hypothetical protein
MQVELLLGSGADPASCNSEGESPLHIVAAHCSVKRVMSLLAHGADVSLVTSEALGALTPMQVCVTVSSASCFVRATVLAGILPTWRTFWSRHLVSKTRPVQIACAHEDPDTMAVLLEACSDAVRCLCGPAALAF